MAVSATAHIYPVGPMDFQPESNLRFGWQFSHLQYEICVAYHLRGITPFIDQQNEKAKVEDFTFEPLLLLNCLKHTHYL